MQLFFLSLAYSLQGGTKLSARALGNTKKLKIFSISVSQVHNLYTPPEHLSASLFLSPKGPCQKESHQYLGPLTEPSQHIDISHSAGFMFLK